MTPHTRADRSALVVHAFIIELGFHEVKVGMDHGESHFEHIPHFRVKSHEKNTL